MAAVDSPAAGRGGCGGAVIGSAVVRMGCCASSPTRSEYVCSSGNRSSGSGHLAPAPSRRGVPGGATARSNVTTLSNCGNCGAFLSTTLSTTPPSLPFQPRILPRRTATVAATNSARRRPQKCLRCAAFCAACPCSSSSTCPGSRFHATASLACGHRWRRPPGDSLAFTMSAAPAHGPSASKTTTGS